MSKKSAAASSASAGKEIDGLIVLIFNRDSTRNPSNVTLVEEQWLDKFQGEFGAIGGFIQDLKYFSRPRPTPPDPAKFGGKDSADYEDEREVYRAVLRNWVAQVQKDDEA